MPNNTSAAEQSDTTYKAKHDQLIAPTSTENDSMMVEPIEDPSLPDQDSSSGEDPSSADIPTDSSSQDDSSNTPAETKPVQKQKTIIHEEPSRYYWYDNWLWVGDGRAVNMTQDVNVPSYAKTNADLTWFKDNANELYKYKHTTIVINIGLQDMNNIQKYIETFNAMPDDFVKNNYIYFMSINPVDEALEKSSESGTYKNKMIENFNNALKANLRNDVYFIDMYSYMQEHGFATFDGIVYDAATNEMIYDRLLATIGA